MEIVLYNNHYEFHFYAGLRPRHLADFLNSLPMGFHFRSGPEELIFDPERGPGLFTLHRKSLPQEDTPIPASEANYYLRWQARASEGDLPRMAMRLAYELSREMETRVWLVDAYGRILRQEGGEPDYPAQSA
ncbi:MAG TPA: hypothetical protein VH186_05605 [Chloroflexia bacterium]|nr:hypothetical protein [Chloroflexia bacterium]